MNRHYLPLQPGLLRRRRIDDLLARGLETPLTTVVADPGYGKTQAVAMFLHNTPRRLVWLNLTPLDNDISHFWDTYLKAVAHELPDQAAALAQRALPQTMMDFSEHLRGTLLEVRRRGAVLLVVDNYNHIHSPQVREFLESLVRVEPDNIRFIIISNARRDYHLGKTLAGTGHLSIINPDLQFTPEEATELLASCGMYPTAAQLANLMARTEGWPLAVHLYGAANEEALALPQNANTYSAAALFEADFFTGYPKNLQRLLAGLSLLPAFSLDMVKQLGGYDTDKVYDDLSTSAFISYNFNTRLFSFHHMYREFLQQKQYMVPEEQRLRIYYVAGEWFMKHGMHLEALDAYWECGAYDEMMGVILRFPAMRANVALTDATLDYLDRLPEEYARGNIMVDFSRAFMYLNGADIAQAMELFTGVVERLEAEEQSDRTRWILGETYAVLADISLLRNTDEFAGHMKKAAAYLPKGSLLHCPELMAVSNGSVFFLPGNTPGQVERMRELMFECSKHARIVMGPHGRGYPWLFDAWAAFYAGDMERAEESGYRAVYQATEVAQHDIVCNAYYVLGLVAAFGGRYADFKQHMEEIPAYLERHNTQQLAELADFARCTLHVTLNELDKVPAWMLEYDRGRQGNLLDSSGRNQLVRGAYLLRKHRSREAIAYLNQMESGFGQRGMWAVRLEAKLLRAACHTELGQEREAVEQLCGAYEMAYANGIITPFMVYGSHLANLLETACKAARRPLDEAWLAAVKSGAAALEQRYAAMLAEHTGWRSRRTPSGAALTRRELEVLNLLARGLTREDIGERLGISVNSVKSHITGIYNKLGAVNRADAIRIATERGHFAAS